MRLNTFFLIISVPFAYSSLNGSLLLNQHVGEQVSLQSSDSKTAPITMRFQSREQLESALSPHSMEELQMCIDSSSIPLTFQYDPGLSESIPISLCSEGPGNLLKNEIFRSKQLSVYYPETPRVPHHLTIALNRQDVDGISNVSEKENQALFATIRKIAEIYKTIQIKGFIIARYDSPQKGHLSRHVVEIIPHLPGFDSVKNIADKVDCNRHVLFRHASISPVDYKPAQKGIEKTIHFWKQSFKQETAPLNPKDIHISFPHCRYESHEEEAQAILHRHLAEILHNKGGKTAQILPLTSIPMPVDMPHSPKTIEITKCPFCDPSVLERQRVFEYNNVEVLYNIRKCAKPGCNFLVLPKRHNEKVYGLSPEEIDDIHKVRKALVEVLKESHPDNEVVTYIQDDPVVGQTVFHSHEQVISVDPHTIALSWTLMSLFRESITDAEMLQIKVEFSQKMQEKINELNCCSYGARVVH